YGHTDCIASISLGAERQFSFRRMDDVSEQCNLVLQNGSLLVMGQHCQQRYQHAILPQSDCQQPRINLTFRKFDYNIHTKSYH
ncbi:MAG: alpha-ketoglutarate-dependent dioxygenase AlkB, partial [Bacteroidota bacterium]